MTIAAEFVERLEALASPEKRASYDRSLRGEQFIGVRMRDVFALAKESIDMDPEEIEKLLENPVHEARVGALSVMDKQARRKRTSDERREELFRLYLGRIDLIDTWDLVDVAAPHVVGGYLFERPRDVLYELAASDNPWARRTAIVATLYFVRQRDVDDTFGIAAVLVGDEHELVQKATGGLLREAGKVDPPRLLRFLDEHAHEMPRPALRNAIERLDERQRKHYLAKAKEKNR